MTTGSQLQLHFLSILNKKVHELCPLSSCVHLLSLCVLLSHGFLETFKVLSPLQCNFLFISQMLSKYAVLRILSLWRKQPLTNQKDNPILKELIFQGVRGDFIILSQVKYAFY